MLLLLYGLSIFCLPHRPNFSDIFDLCLHWVSVVRGSHVFFQSRARLFSFNFNSKTLMRGISKLEQICLYIYVVRMHNLKQSTCTSIWNQKLILSLTHLKVFPQTASQTQKKTLNLTSIFGSSDMLGCKCLLCMSTLRQVELGWKNCLPMSENLGSIALAGTISFKKILGTGLFPG